MVYGSVPLLGISVSQEGEVEDLMDVSEVLTQWALLDELQNKSEWW